MNFQTLFTGALVVLAALCASSCRTGAAENGGASYVEFPPSAQADREGEWRPLANVTLRTRVICEGTFVARACRVEIERPATDAGPALLLAREPCGQSAPILGTDSDRMTLILTGEDGRGGWRQSAMFIEAGPSIRWTRRRYDDGL